MVIGILVNNDRHSPVLPPCRFIHPPPPLRMLQHHRGSLRHLISLLRRFYRSRLHFYPRTWNSTDRPQQRKINWASGILRTMTLAAARVGRGMHRLILFLSFFFCLWDHSDQQVCGASRVKCKPTATSSMWMQLSRGKWDWSTIQKKKKSWDLCSLSISDKKIHHLVLWYALTFLTMLPTLTFPTDNPNQCEFLL